MLKPRRLCPVHGVRAAVSALCLALPLVSCVAVPAVRGETHVVAGTVAIDNPCLRADRRLVPGTPGRPRKGERKQYCVPR